MVDLETTSMRSVVMDMLKNRFKDSPFWKEYEAEFAVMCAELPEVTSDAQRIEMIDGLKNIKKKLEECDIRPKDLVFLTEEISRYKHTKQISLYVEADDQIDQDVIDKYSRLSVGSEGVMGIHLPYTYQQVARLTNGVYDKTGLIKFYISREKTIYGKIVAEIYEFSQKIPIATLIEAKKVSKETGEPLFKQIKLFGEKYEKHVVKIIKEIEIPFYVYRFITETNQELILFTIEHYDIGDYIITGMQTQCDDYKMLTDSAKLPTKLPYFFAQQLRNRVIKFKSHAQFLEKLVNMDYMPDDMFNFPFSLYVSKRKKHFLLNHPEWFKWLMWAWHTHAPMGLFNNYPLHLLIVGPQHSGKSLMLNCFHAKTKESRDIFSGSSSTLKNLVPSFKYNPARLGYLAESNRFAYCDEFLRCIVNTRTTIDGSQREESVAMMNDLLEHQKREAGSGVSRIHVNMTSRIIATTNPVHGIHNVSDLANMLDPSFLSRLLIYFQTKNHVDMIRKSRDAHLKEWNYMVSSNDWVSILDYLHTFSSEYDMKKVDEVYESVIPALNETLSKHYDARHGHHIECIIDGLVKTRCILEKDMSFKAKAVDYERLKMVWQNILGSWIDIKQVKKLPIYERVYYMPIDAQWIYWHIVKLKRPVHRQELKDAALLEMSKNTYLESMMVLSDNELISTVDNMVKPHALKEPNKDAK